VSAETVSTASKRLAAIDIGSNSVRLLIADASADGSYKILDDEKKTTRLAQGLSATGLLSDDAIQQTVEALARMKVIVEGYGVDRPGIIATSAVREAANRDIFLKLVRERLGLHVDVISPDEEAMLSFHSVAKHFDLRNQDVVVVDLGGGSAELIFAVKGVVEEVYSLPLGSVRLSDAFITTDPLSAAEEKALRKHVLGTLEERLRKPILHPQVMIGAGGTFTALASIALRRRGGNADRLGGVELNRSEVRHICQYLQNLPLRARRAVPGLNPDRAEIIVPGLIVVERFMKAMNVNRLLIHDQGVRDGLMLKLMAQSFKQALPPPAEDGDALASVWQFAVSCGIDQGHTRHVTRLAKQLFEQMKGQFQLSEADELILEAAALLHEVGNLINYKKHHHHTYHLIMHGNFRGLTPGQRELVANVARYHRRAAPKPKHENFARLSAADQDTVRRLSAFLRLADGLDRSHTQRVKDVVCRRRGERLYVAVHADESPDVDLWGAQEKGKLFEKVFGLKLKFGWAQASAHNGNGTVRKTGRGA
jgi:exopolyphosphatase/guanosine-5'-triphosphate,3'-diphosphate pyrophosphatase